MIWKLKFPNGMVGAEENGSMEKEDDRWRDKEIFLCLVEKRIG